MFYHEDGCSGLLRNVSPYLLNYTASHPRRLSSWYVRTAIISATYNLTTNRFIGQNLDLQGGGNSVFCVTTQLNAGSVFRVNLHGLTLKMATVCPARWLLPTPQNIRCSSQQDYGTNQPITFVDEWNTNLMSLAILFHFLCAQHVSGINISIFRSLRLCWWIITSVVLFSVRCVLEL